MFIIIVTYFRQQINREFDVTVFFWEYCACDPRSNHPFTKSQLTVNSPQSEGVSDLSDPLVDWAGEGRSTQIRLSGGPTLTNLPKWKKRTYKVKSGVDPTLVKLSFLSLLKDKRGLLYLFLGVPLSDDTHSQTQISHVIYDKIRTSSTLV